MAMAMGGAFGLAACGPAHREGLILYHAVSSVSPDKKIATRPVTLIFTTGDSDLTGRGDLHTQAGVITGAGATRRSTKAEEERIARSILGSAAGSSTRILSPEQFADLWDRLEAAGLFELVPHEGTKPPEDRAYFLLDAEGRKLIFEKPPVPSRQAAPGKPAGDDAGEMMRRWLSAQAEMIRFLNEQ